MGFFDSLRHLLGRDDASASAEASLAWGLDEQVEKDVVNVEAGLYDRTQWVKKMKRILAGLPASEGQWAELMSDALALQLEPEFITKTQVDEFMLLVRRAVADRHFTETEHRKLDLARDLIGIPEEEAEAALRSVLAEAESFFGKAVERTDKG